MSKLINFLDNTVNQWSKSRTRNCVKINDELGEKYNASNQIKFNSFAVASRCEWLKKVEFMWLVILLVMHTFMLKKL